ncbi:MAG: ATP-dependent DNA helicase RecG [Saprospiraceae bacterium]|nr:ATP-dependent DNA helicase RecG [Saprospiraceae bacterium]
MSQFLREPVSTLPGLGGIKAALLRSELGIVTVGDLIQHYPYRYVDKTLIRTIRDVLTNPDTALVQGILSPFQYQGHGHKKRLVAYLRDGTGTLELVWFKGGKVIEGVLQPGQAYTAYGKIQRFRGKATLVHPEMELLRTATSPRDLTFDPIYSTTEGLSKKGLDTKGIRKLLRAVIPRITPGLVPETLPSELLSTLRLPGRVDAIRNIHFPPSQQALEDARKRLKFEELLFLQLDILLSKKHRNRELVGYVFDAVGEHFNRFYAEFLPFALTEAQKRVMREIRRDLGMGSQMNRLLQGDVGSGKTVVALMAMLIALDNGYQSCLVAPTEILAQQHFQSLKDLVRGMGIQIGLLTGSVTGQARKLTLQYLAEGRLHILIGTHAVLEDPVIFQQLGLAITDEQHRFGVAQRAALWKKSTPHPPHVLVMTATPIPRTLALTIYGDLDVSIIDELPPGRKPIKTELWYENKRLRLIGFMKEQIAAGRQVYIVYPLIEESASLDLLNLEEGLSSLQREFQRPEYQISVVHGRMASADKEMEMQRFQNKETQIMVATTVIEVGVNIPNASIMVIENAERFGLSQLHQLRGRVGRGADQSYCILMTNGRLSDDARIRLQTMCRTNDGFEIADVDLKLRGPGDLEGTRQSGVQGLKIADLREDGAILQSARTIAAKIVDADEHLEQPANLCLKRHLQETRPHNRTWSRIS